MTQGAKRRYRSLSCSNIYFSDLYVTDMNKAYVKGCYYSELNIIFFLIKKKYKIDEDLRRGMIVMMEKDCAELEQQRLLGVYDLGPRIVTAKRSRPDWVC